MARNGAGTYILPAGQPVVTGTTISSTTHNTLANDLANALTSSVAVDGQSVVTANIPLAGFKLTGIGAATVNGDAVRYQQVGALALAQGAAASGPIATSGLTSMGYGQCQLTLSAGSLKLAPKNGNLLTVNGVSCTIPDAGVTLAATGLLATTLYYIYAVATAGVITSLEASTTGHSTDTTAGNKGVEIKTGDSTRTMVGWAYVKTAATFADTLTQRFVRSWFNDTGLHLGGASVTATVSNTTFVEISSAGRIEFVARTGDFGLFATSSFGFPASAGNTAYSSISVDSTTGGSANNAGLADIANNYVGMSASLSVGFTEGYHFVSPSMRATSGFSATVTSSLSARVG